MKKRRKPIKLKQQKKHPTIKKTNYKISGVKRITKRDDDSNVKISKINYNIFYSVILLTCIGVIMITSASGFFALYTKGDIFFFIKNTVKWLFVGSIAMGITMCIDYHHYERLTFYLFIVTFILLVIVLFQPDMNGATRWIYIGGFSFQPSEIAKYSIVFYLATSLVKRKELNENFTKGPFFYIAVSGIFALLIERENNLSIATIIMIVTCILIYLGGVKLWHIFCIAIPGAVGLLALITKVPYRMQRLLGFLHPWDDPTGNTFQLIQSFYALGSGGVMGSGIGKSMIKYLYMPEPHNDFIFAIIGEELGLIGCVSIIILYIIFTISGFSVSKNAIDEYGKLLSAGITLIIITQAAINIAVVTGSMPVTGVPLPFVSYGGTSLVINMAAVGVLLNISRHKRIVNV